MKEVLTDAADLFAYTNATCPSDMGRHIGQQRQMARLLDG
jgi:hypothetical protein